MGSDSKSNGGGGQLTAAERKLVHSLKEIVNMNCTDSEIYAVLKECGMDPNDAAQRLLSQDTFREVKSKRERRKELKETHESRPRANNGASNIGGRVGSEHISMRNGSLQSSSTELGKTAYRRENASVAPLQYTSSVYRTSWKSSNDNPSPHSDSFNGYSSVQPTRTMDTTPSTMLPSSGVQSVWPLAASGPVSMADIVRLGKSSQDSLKPSHAQALLPELHQDSQSQHSSGVPEFSSDQHNFDNGWPLIEQRSDAPALIRSTPSESKMFSSESHTNGNNANFSRNYSFDEVQESERTHFGENLKSEPVGSASASSRHITAINVQEAPNASENTLEGNSSGNINTTVSSATVSLQKLNLDNEELSPQPKEDNPVVLPSFLQELAADCSHLSFGTYKSGNEPASSGQLESNTFREQLEEAPSSGADSSSTTRSDPRYMGAHTDEEIRFMYDLQRKAESAKNHDLQRPAEAELMSQNILEATHGQKHYAASTLLDSSFKNIQNFSSPLSFAPDQSVRNLPALPSELHSYANSMPYDLLESTVQSLRARESLPFSANQSLPSRYSGAISSISSSPAIHLSEALNSGAFSISHPSSHGLPGANLGARHVLPQQLSAHSYSDFGYLGMQQNYPYKPSLGQVYPDGNTFKDSLPGPKYNMSQYRSAGDINGLPLSSPVASDYNSFGTSPNISGSFLHNLSAAPSPKVGYEDILRPQYKDGNAFTLQQNDNLASWNYGHGLRPTSTVPDGTYYSLLGQSPLPIGYRQSQQQPPLQTAYGGSGYPSMFNHEVGITRERQSDSSLNGSQSPSSKQLKQIWQPSY